MIVERVTVEINGQETAGEAGQTILQAVTEQGGFIPSICYQPQLGPIRTCDTCMVEADGELVRACSTPIQPGMRISTESPLVKEEQLESMSRILKNHELYCTVCDNNNGNCIVHNTTERLEMAH